MSDESENCPVYSNEIKNHPKFVYAKIEKILQIIDNSLELTRSILQECDKDPDKNDLAIKYLLNQKELLNKLKETLS